MSDYKAIAASKTALNAVLPKMNPLKAVTIGQRLRTEGIGRRLIVTPRQGRVTSVETCTSQEGVHLMAKKRKTELADLQVVARAGKGAGQSLALTLGLNT